MRNRDGISKTEIESENDKCDCGVDLCHPYNNAKYYRAWYSQSQLEELKEPSFNVSPITSSVTYNHTQT